MSSDSLHMLRHRVKGTLQQVDAVIDMVEKTRATDPQGASELAQELAKSLELIAQLIRKETNF